MRIVRYDPFRDIRKMMWNGFPSLDEWENVENNLSVDIYETDESVVVQTDLPGVKPEDVDIQVTGENVTIQAERKEEIEEKKRDYLRRERNYGRYARTISLPTQVIPDQADAKFKGGCLVITIPKEKKHQPSKVQIKVEDKNEN